MVGNENKGSSVSLDNYSETKWLGYADLASKSAEMGLGIEIATFAEQVLINSPVVTESEVMGAPNVLSVSMGARLIGDPFLRFVGGLFLLVLTILTAFANIGSWYDGKKD